MSDEPIAEQKNIQNEAVNPTPPEEVATEVAEAPPDEPTVQKAEFEDFGQAEGGKSNGQKIEMLMDIVLPVSIELGRTKMFIKNILDLERGSIVELDKMAGEPVDLLVNNKKMAEGEVVVVDKHFGVRITNLIDPTDRIKNLGNVE